MTAEEQAAKDAADKAAKDAADKVQDAADKKKADQRAEDQKKLEAEQSKVPVIIAGDAVLGGPFSITGPGLGNGGVLTIGGREIPTTRWDDRSIRGELPPATKGDVVLKTDSGTRRGTFPPPKPVVAKVTTTTVETVPSK